MANMNSAVLETVLDANVLVPTVLVVFFAVNLGTDPKYAEIRSAISAVLRSPSLVLPEVLGFAGIALALLAGFRLCPGGAHASAAELQSLRTADAHLFWLRGQWPVLLHPDSLLTIQQMLVALGAALFLFRGACAHGSGALALSFTLLSVTQGLRASLWALHADYVPEGPIGGFFGAVVSTVTLVVLLLAAGRSIVSARSAGVSIFKGTLNLTVVLALSAWLAWENHLTVSDSLRSNVAFSMMDAIELFAAPLLMIGACAVAEKTPRLSGALVSMVVAQVCGVYWLLDFIGMLNDPASEDSGTKLDMFMKKTLQSYVHGHPFALFASSQAVRMLGTVAACIACSVLRLSAPAPAAAPAVAAAAAGRPLLNVYEV